MVRDRKLQELREQFAAADRKHCPECPCRQDILDDLRSVQRLNGDTYSSAEILGMIGRAANEIEAWREWFQKPYDNFTPPPLTKGKQ